MLTIFYVLGVIASALYFHREGLPDMERLPLLIAACLAWPLVLPLHYIGRKE